MEETTAFITDDKITFGLLMITLAIIFYTASIKTGFWKAFYNVVPALLLCYLIPAIFTSTGLINETSSNLYYMASRYLLPAALVLMTLSIDLKGIFNLGPKALIMFFTGTVGIIIGGPLAILIIATFSPETIGGAGPDAVWRGLSTLAGSWIGGGANQAAMLEIYKYNPAKYGGMVLVDILVANVWMAVILFGIGKRARINQWLQADTTAIETLKEKVSTYAASVKREATFTDYMVMLGLAFGAVGIAHLGAKGLSALFSDIPTDAMFGSLTSSFFWLVTIATILGIALSFTKAKKYEGAGASKLGSICIYILVATIGMKIDLMSVLKDPGLIAIGFVWMTIHAGLLILVAKLIKAPYFFLAVGSQANVGGAASAPVVAAEFHSSLATVGVLLAVFGYVVGTYGAIFCTSLMQIASGG